MIKKITIVLLLNILLIFNVKALDLSSTNYILYNLNDNTIVLEKDSKEIISIASLTKIMTVYVAIEHIDNYDKTITITSKMIEGLIEQDALVVGFRVGEEVTMNDLLYATFLESGADAARALSLSIFGSEEEFVNQMNNKTKELNLELSFKNVVGLDEQGHYGTADSVAHLLMYTLQNDKFKEIFNTKEYTSSNGRLFRSSAFKTAEKYDIDIHYIEGAKTGYTDDAGKCLASVAFDEENNIKYMLVTIGADTTIENAYHILDAKTIYDYYFTNYKYYNVLNIDDLLTTINIKYSKQSIDIKSNSEIKIYYDTTFNENNIRIEYSGIKEVSPFIGDNIELGKVDIYYVDELLDTIILSTSNLDSNILIGVQKQLGLNCLIIIIILIIFLSITHLFIKKKYRHKKRVK